RAKLSFGILLVNLPRSAEHQELGVDAGHCVLQRQGSEAQGIGRKVTSGGNSRHPRYARYGGQGADVAMLAREMAERWQRARHVAIFVRAVRHVLQTAAAVPTSTRRSPGPA